MAPVALALRGRPGVTSRVCVTGQHRQMLDQVLELFGIEPEHDLSVMQQGQSLSALTGRILQALDPVLDAERPDRVLVHGDTTTTLATALAAYYRRIPVAHVEAGLRTRDIYSPWPEEINRQATARIADLHFAPTPRAASNLLDEGVPAAGIDVTGNTVIDALRWVERCVLPRIDAAMRRRFAFLPPEERVILLTGHRRENLDGGLVEIFTAVRGLAEGFGLQVVYPVHLNPAVRSAAEAVLGDCQRVHLIEPLDYPALVWVLRRCDLVVTDSGGIQEEAPSLGKPVLVTREVTERPEAVDAGVVKLVGTSAERVLVEASRLLTDPAAYAAMSRRGNPYGDGQAATRIADRVLGSVTAPAVKAA